ncbi:TPA: ead/Ea22-like family protein [Klebsiella pneumoniae]|nr:ead/Ea22-like family protein [Klebsiella pneumoniae]HCT8003552.1 ead/Ea22-like family protein [Klebsiella pneumoniae]
MTNITELAQRMKAAAEKATPGPWYVHDKPCEDGNYGIDTSDKEFLAEAVVWWGFARQSIWREEDAKYIALANPANILALVEALETEKRICATWRKTAESTSEKLEKAQAAERRWHRVASRVHEQACESDVKIDELEAIRAAAEKLVRCKGRYHSEQNYRALAALFGVNTPDLPPLDDESRAVNVENLQESAYRAGLTAGWNLGLANNNDGFNKCLAAHTAGIKVEAE